MQWRRPVLVLLLRCNASAPGTIYPSMDRVVSSFAILIGFDRLTEPHRKSPRPVPHGRTSMNWQFCSEARLAEVAYREIRYLTKVRNRDGRKTGELESPHLQVKYLFHETPARELKNGLTAHVALVLTPMNSGYRRSPTHPRTPPLVLQPPPPFFAAERALGWYRSVFQRVTAAHALSPTFSLLHPHPRSPTFPH